MNEQVPVPPQGSDEGGNAGVHNTLNVDNLHIHGNDIRELTRLAQTDPDLAHKIVDQAADQARLEADSYRLALVVSLILFVAIIIGVAYVVVHSGVLALVCVIATILATAALVRAILTGEWSDTSWIGQLLGGFLRLMGGKPPSGKDDPADPSGS